MQTFFSRLEARSRSIDSLLCIGLDPHPESLPARTPEAVRDFCLRLIEATASSAAAFKPNSAFFEALGPPGLSVLGEVIAAVPDGIPVLLDAKRGDIASTARAYATAVFETLGADAVTIHPYLGRDALEPFLQSPSRAVFLICKSSNPGAADLQDRLVVPAGGGQPRPLFELAADLARQWNERDNLGLVVGATQVESLRRVRELAPELWILAPGVGAQGGDLEAALEAGLRSDGLGLLVPVSRGIARAEDPAAAAAELRVQLNTARKAYHRRRTAGHRPAAAGREQAQGPSALNAIAEGLIEAGCVRFGDFTTKAGLKTPIYIDLRRLSSYPELLERVAAAYRPILEALTFDHLAALPYAALPIGTAIALQGGWSLLYPRKEVKDYGTGAVVEGVFSQADRAVVIDDLATTGASKFEGIEKLQAAGLEVRDIVVLIDRQSGARAAAEAAGFGFHAVFELAELLDYWQEAGRISPSELAEVRRFLSQSAG